MKATKKLLLIYKLCAVDIYKYKIVAMPQDTKAKQKIVKMHSVYVLIFSSLCCVNCAHWSHDIMALKKVNPWDDWIRMKKKNEKNYAYGFAHIFTHLQRNWMISLNDKRAQSKQASDKKPYFSGPKMEMFFKLDRWFWWYPNKPTA